MTSIEAIQQQTTASGVFQVLQSAISAYGFERFIFSGLPDPGMDVRPFVMFCGWSDEWFAHYAEKGYVHFDPIPRQAMATTLPFDWPEAFRIWGEDPNARQVIEDAREFGMVDGFCVPIHMDGGIQGVVSLAGDSQALTSRLRLELHMLVLYAHGQLRRFNSGEALPAPGPSITGREAEVLKWVAAGKTASEVADITGLTSRTVNQHCENAQRRLGTSNRVQTVVEAIRHRLIAL